MKDHSRHSGEKQCESLNFRPPCADKVTSDDDKGDA
jgi:hypothetical protein